MMAMRHLASRSSHVGGVERLQTITITIMITARDRICRQAGRTFLSGSASVVEAIEYGLHKSRVQTELDLSICRGFLPGQGRNRLR